MITAVRYAAETVRNMPVFKEAMPSQSADAELDAYLHNAVNLTMSAPGTFGSAFYDMVRPDTAGACRIGARQEVALAAHRIMLLQDIVDTRLDTFPEPLSEKERFLDDGLAFLAGDIIDTPSRKDDLRYRAAFTLAGVIRDMPLLRGNMSALIPAFTELVDVAKEQFVCSDPERLVDIARTIGASCIEQTVIPVEVALDTAHLPVRKAARSIGSYGQLLDHLTEIDEDIRDDSNTFATFMIKKYGDSKRLRREIRERFLDEAADEYKAGAEDLTPRQKRIYRALRHIIDAKYKGQNRLRSFRQKHA